jgi:hypothetical protein
MTMKTSAEVLRSNEAIRWKGRTITVDALTVNGQTFVVTGRFIKKAELRRYGAEDIIDPIAVIRQLKSGPLRVDILKFWQRLPDTQPKYSYYREWQHVAAIPVNTHEHWFQKQIRKNARNGIRKAARGGVEVKEEPLSDQLVSAIMELYNESPVRRGKPFWHYGKDFDTVKAELSADLEKAAFLTAYDKKELIGFMKLLIEDRFVRTTLLFDKLSRRGKFPSPMNSLFSKAVELCATRSIPYVVYSVWRRGAHGDFQESNGFVKMSVPEYFVPLTVVGRIALWIRLHHGIRGWIPDWMMGQLLECRRRWYALRFRRHGSSQHSVRNRAAVHSGSG